MTHEPVQDKIPSYVLDALDPSESTQVREHARGCDQCKHEIQAYRLVPDALNIAVPDAPLPDGFTARLVGRATSAPAQTSRSRRSRRPLLPWLAAAACLILALALGGRAWQLGNQLEAQLELNGRMAALMAQTGVAESELAATRPGARGRLYVAPDARAAVLVLHGLGTLPEGKVYQLWLNGPGGRRNGGTFVPQAGGSALLYLQPAQGLGEVVRVGVTVEPTGGSPGPTTPRVIGGDL